MRERASPALPEFGAKSSGHGVYTGQGDGNSSPYSDTQEWSSGYGFYEIDITQDRMSYSAECRDGEGYGYGCLNSQYFLQEVQALRGYY